MKPKTIMVVRKSETGGKFGVNFIPVQYSPIKMFFKRMMDAEYRKEFERTPVLVRINKGSVEEKKFVAYANEGTINQLFNYGRDFAKESGVKLKPGMGCDIGPIEVSMSRMKLVGKGEWFVGHVISKFGKKEFYAQHRLLLEQ